MSRVALLALVIVLLGGGFVVLRPALEDTPACDPPTAQWASVPGGTFDMGGTLYAEEGPVRPVTVAPFEIRSHEVTNAEFAAFVAATGYVTRAEQGADPALHPDLPALWLKPGGLVFSPPDHVSNLTDLSQWWRFAEGASWRAPGGPGTSVEGKDHLPATQIALEDARAYAAWAGGRLPSEAEWEWAARGADPDAPSTDTAPPSNANTWQGVFPIVNLDTDGFIGIAPVGCFKANRLGLSDMIGNLWEWTESAYDAGRGVIKGGSYLCAPNYCARYRPEARQGQEVDLPTNHIGFRIVR